MKIFLKDGKGSRFTVYVACENCRKLIKKYVYDTEKNGISRKDTGKLLDDIKLKMLKGELNYCYRCGTKNFSERGSK